jgi:hypothetical protein
MLLDCIGEFLQQFMSLLVRESKTSDTFREVKFDILSTKRIGIDILSTKRIGIDIPALLIANVRHLDLQQEKELVSPGWIPAPSSSSLGY